MAASVRHKVTHHLSSKSDAHGWVESIARLTETTPATELLNDKHPAAQVCTSLTRQLVCKSAWAGGLMLVDFAGAADAFD